jgi:hypothetical protein
MRWGSAHPLVVDPDADRPTLIGSRWVRREPLGDAWDGPVEVVGCHDNGPDHGGLEMVIRTVAFTGEPVLTATPESFGAAYKREGDDNPAERLNARLRELEARG